MSRSLQVLSSSLLVCWMPFFKLPVWISIHLLFWWCQQHYSSAWNIPSGTWLGHRLGLGRAWAEMAILSLSWNHLKDLSNYMLRVEWGWRWRQPSIYWETTQRISMKSFICLLLNIFSVSFTVSFFVLDTSSNHFLCLNTAHPDPADQALELEQEPETEKKFTLLQRLKLKINRGRTWRLWWGRNWFGIEWRNVIDSMTMVKVQ